MKHSPKKDNAPDILKMLIYPISNLIDSFSKQQEIDFNKTSVQSGIANLFYCTFVVRCINNQIGVSSKKISEVRELIVKMIKITAIDKSAVNLTPDDINNMKKLYDRISDLINTIKGPYLYMSLYDSYLDMEIYKKFHDEQEVFYWGEILLGISSKTLEVYKILFNESGKYIDLYKLPKYIFSLRKNEKEVKSIYNSGSSRHKGKK